MSRYFPLIALWLLLVSALPLWADAAYTVGKTTYVPISALTYGLSMKVGYDAKTKTLTFTSQYVQPKRVAKLTVGSTAAKIDNKPVILETAPVVLAGTTYLPLGKFTEKLGMTATANKTLGTITLESDVFMGTTVLVPAVISAQELALRQKPLTIAQRKAVFNAVRKGNAAQVAKLMTANPALRFATDDLGDLPLHCAARHGLGKMVDKLLAVGASINDANRRGDTALHVAVNPGVMHSFGEKEELGNLADIPDSAPTIDAMAMVSLLIKRGARVNSRNFDGETPLFAVCGVFADGPEMVALLLEKGANVSLQDSQGYTPLHEAAKWGNAEAADMLLKLGAKVEAVNTDGETPFFLAGGSNLSNDETWSVLLEHGANVNTKNANGKTPLHKICELQGSDDEEVAQVNFLLEHGAKVDLTDDDGGTPLHSASIGGNAGIVKALIAKGADVNAKNDYNDTPLSIAKEMDRTEVVKVLEDAGAK